NPRRLQEVAWFDVFFEPLKSRSANRRTDSVLPRHFCGDDVIGSAHGKPSFDARGKVAVR
ncbi:MAG: hypothetical protein ACAH22_07855, partial [Tardiphaga sp.]